MSECAMQGAGSDDQYMLSRLYISHGVQCMRRTHHSGLNHIHWGSNADSKEPSSETRCYVAGDSVREQATSYEGLLDLQQSTLRTDVATETVRITVCRNAHHN